MALLDWIEPLESPCLTTAEAHALRAQLEADLSWWVGIGQSLLVGDKPDQPSFVLPWFTPLRTLPPLSYTRLSAFLHGLTVLAKTPHATLTLTGSLLEPTGTLTKPQLGVNQDDPFWTPSRLQKANWLLTPDVLDIDPTHLIDQGYIHRGAGAFAPSAFTGRLMASAMEPQSHHDAMAGLLAAQPFFDLLQGTQP
jgi:hypothetical protein